MLWRSMRHTTPKTHTRNKKRAVVVCFTGFFWSCHRSLDQHRVKKGEGREGKEGEGKGREGTSQQELLWGSYHTPIFYTHQGHPVVVSVALSDLVDRRLRAA